ncbi:MAG: hypothetical protein HC887_09370 [Desulfobacteraceae bacterium]|nr:hypothetical protein [Desulfobacteraceae bacterium]
MQQTGAVADTDAVLMVVPQKTLHFILERHIPIRQVLEKRIEFLDKEILRIRKLEDRGKRRFQCDTWSDPKRGERIIRGFPMVEQAEEKDCGAACLAMICKHYDIPMTLGKLREAANITTEGATLGSLVRAAESLGFSAQGIRCTYQTLLDADIPFIVHWKGYHYIVAMEFPRPMCGLRTRQRDFRK